MIKIRRRHKKSRNGCKECKARHTKCDETRPSCRNCAIINQACSFLDWRQSQLPQPPQPLAPVTSPAAQRASSPAQIERSQAQEFTMVHLELLHHLDEGLFKNLHLGAAQASQLCKLTIRCALSTSYLMDQILALSAAHMSTIRRNKQALYQNEAAELQTRALTRLNSDGMDVSHSNSLPMFLYSSFLSIHAMFDALRHRQLEPFLEDFVTYLAIHRGVRAFISQSWPETKYIVELIVGDRSIFDRIPRGGGGECQPLAAMIDDSTALDAAEKEACWDVVEALQWAFNLSHASPESRTRVHFASLWATVLPLKFLDMLRLRKQEALAILAFHGVFLHQSRDFWVFGDSGQFLVRAISDHLGPCWADTLAWPNQQLERSLDVS